MKKVKDFLLKTMAKFIFWVAKRAANSASAPSLYQPKEPESIRKLCKYIDETH